MMTLEAVRAALFDRRLKTVAEQTGLSYDTIWRVRAGEDKRVSYDVVKRLSDYLSGVPING